MINWIKELRASITLTDIDGKILEMNDKAVATFQKYGSDLIGKSLFDFHNENSSLKIKEMLRDGTENIYTIEKNGVKKIIIQYPWFQNDKISGLVEFSFEIPFEMPNYIRT